MCIYISHIFLRFLIDKFVTLWRALHFNVNATFSTAMVVALNCFRSTRMAGFLGYTLSVVSSFLRPSHSSSKQRVLSEIDPFVLHKTLCRSDLAGKDLLIIGDVHGCFDEMLLLIAEARERTKKSLVKIFVGDMINKGPKSEKVLSYLLSQPDIHCVRGNHEQKVLGEYFAYKKMDAESVPEKRVWVKNLLPSYVDFMKNLPYTISIPFLNIIVVHAGLMPSVHLSLQNTNDLLNMRNFFWESDTFHGKVLKATFRPDVGAAWADHWPGPEHVYFGHDAVRKLQLREHSTGLDTGCVYGGDLSASLLTLDESGDLIGKQILSVKHLKVYVPVCD